MSHAHHADHFNASRRYATLLVFGIVLAWCPGAKADAPQCQPSVRLEGDAEARGVISETLEANGVLSHGEVGCARLVVQVSRDEEGLTLRMADVEGRTAQRTVSDAKTAATVIESWATPDLMAPAEPAAQPAPAPSLTESSPTKTAAHVGEPRERGYAIGIWLGPSVSEDRGLWGDLTITGCGRIGPVCLGGGHRVSIDFGGHGRAAESDTDRRSIDLFASLEIPIIRKKLAVSPGVAAGVGWLQMSLDDDGPGRLPDQETEQTDASFRLAATLSVSTEIVPRLRFGGRLAFEVAPFARNQFTDDQGTKLTATPVWQFRTAIGVQFDTFR